MADDPEFEMLVNVLKAQAFIRNAEGWLVRNPANAGRLNDAKHALQRIVDDCSEENQRLAVMQVLG
jgi:hypothetical protein